MNKNTDVLVSVLMPAYNAERFIKQAIESILNQTYPHIELLIADDASKDKTKKIIDSYADGRIKRHHNVKNMGYLKTWNKLIAEAKGTFITFQDADDACDLKRIELLLKAFEENPDAAVCGSNYKRITEKGETVYVSDFALKHKDIVAKMPQTFDVVGSAVMIKRKVYESIGGYRNYFDRIGCEDYDWLCLISEKYQIMNIQEASYYYRFSDNSITRSFKNRRNLYSIELVKFLFRQRKETGTDAIKSERLQELIDYEAELDKPFREDPSFFYYSVGKRLYYEGEKQRALQFLRKAILRKPLKFKYYKDFFYFLRH